MYTAQQRSIWTQSVTTTETSSDKQLWQDEIVTVEPKSIFETVLHRAPIKSQTLFFKRIFDISVCMLLMPFVLPVMAVVALAIRLESKGGVIFHQTRIGKFGETFTCFKFRSMRIDAEEIKAQLADQNEADGPVFKMKNDPRITRVGRIIRKLSLDELPQIFNVVYGDMSLVGPRPAVPKEVIVYNNVQLQRLATIPGLTGLQQVSGRSDLDFERWVELDLQYVREQSLRKDVEILLRTVPAVVLCKGAY